MRLHTSKELVVLNLEATITDFVVKNVLDDLGLNSNGNGHRETHTAPMSEQRARFLGWVASKSETDLDPLLDTTTERAGERLAPWARLLISAHAVQGRAICLYSCSVPEPIVDAYADGIEKAVSGAEVESVMGRPLLKNGKRYSGELGDAPKTSFVEGLLARDREIHLLADSFLSGLRAMQLARHKLVVNPDDHLREKTAVQAWHRLKWSYKAPDTSLLAAPHAKRPQAYNLGERADQARLLADLPGLLQ